MRDLLRNYKMLLRRKDSSDSESQPLMSSTSASSFGATSLLDESTDCEAGKTTVKPAVPLVSPSTFARPFCYPTPKSSGPPVYDVYNCRDYDRLEYFTKVKGILNLSDASSLLSHGTSYKDAAAKLDAGKTQNSLVTIFAIWNTIMGSSLLAMGWGMLEAGLLPGILLNILVAGICLYTCFVILQVNEDHGLLGHDNQVSDLCRMLIGKWAEVLAKVFSLIVLTGANIVYWVLMSNFLYHTVQFLHDLSFSSSVRESMRNDASVICPPLNSTPNSSSVTGESVFEQVWDLYSTVPIVLAMFMFPLLNFKSPTFFTKFNSLGTLSVMYLLSFVAVKSFSWGINITDWWAEMRLKPTFLALSGMLSLSYFIHNIIISIMRNNRRQEKNSRDLTIAFGLVTFTYLFVGVCFYVCFPTLKSCIQDNLLNNFEKYDTLTIIARALLLFQLCTVFPLISFMLRNDIFSNLNIIFKDVGFSYKKVIILNAFMVTIYVMFACFLPKIGTLIRYTGALSGLVYIFLLPSLLKMASLKKKGKLSICRLTFHVAVILFGVVNLLSQFFIK